MVRPEGVIAPVREVCVEAGIFLLTAYPVKEIKHSHCTEGFDKHFAAIIKFPEFIIALDHKVEFYLRIEDVSRQEHPHVLDRGAHEHVVEVYE